MADQVISSVANLDQKTAALEMVLRRHGVLSDNFVHDFTEHADDAWVTANGANTWSLAPGPIRRFMPECLPMVPLRHARWASIFLSIIATSWCLRIRRTSTM
jgi:hypothetical protein